MARVLFLMPTNTYRASAFLAAAERLKIDAVVGSDRRQALESVTSGRTLTLNFCNLAGATQQICDFSQRHKINAIIPVDEDTAVLASHAAEALSLRHASPAGAFAAREKHRMRAILAGTSLPSPDFQVFLTSENPEDVREQIVYPCVLKPVALSSSRGVIRANNKTEFVRAFHRIRAILETTEVAKQGGGLGNRILVEDYIPGDEVAVEGILKWDALQVLALFDKPDPLEGPYFEETIYVTPSRRPQKVQRQIFAAVWQAAKALGIDHGPVHAELRVNPDGAWIIDIAARSIGGLCSKVLRFDDGLSLEEVILKHAIGEDVGSAERESQAAGVMMIPIPRAGILKKVRGLKQAKSVAGIEDVMITIPLTQQVVPLPEGNRYLGFIFARGGTAENVEHAIRAAFGRLEFAIEAS